MSRSSFVSRYCLHFVKVAPIKDAPTEFRNADAIQAVASINTHHRGLLTTNLAVKGINGMFPQNSHHFVLLLLWFMIVSRTAIWLILASRPY